MNKNTRVNKRKAGRENHRIKVRISDMFSVRKANTKNIRHSVTSVLLVLVMILQVLKAAPGAYAEEAEVYSRTDEMRGYSGAKIGIHSLNGDAAYCVEPEKNWPDQGTIMRETEEKPEKYIGKTKADLVMAVIQTYNVLGENDGGGRRLASVLIRYICLGYIDWDETEGKIYFNVNEDPEGFALDYTGIENFQDLKNELEDYDSGLNRTMRERTQTRQYRMRQEYSDTGNESFI